MRVKDLSGSWWMRGAWLIAALAASGTLCGCVAVGVSSRGGWFIWPSGGVLLVLLVIFLLMRRR